MRVTSLAVLFPAVLAFGACNSEPLAPEITHLPRALTAAEQQIVASDNTFAFSLFREIAAESSPDSNIFISPLSVAMALGMQYNGAGGVTAAEMQQTLALQGMSLDDVDRSYQSLIALLRGLDKRVAFSLANSIWYNPSLTPLPTFLSATRSYFDATVQSLDFQSAGAAPTINGWVNQQTNGKIPAIVPDPISTDAVMFLINAIYFKGDWTEEFDPARTRPSPFTLRSGVKISVMTMSHGYAVPIGYASDGATVIVDLPYGGGAFSMTIILPALGGMDSLVSSLTNSRWNGWLAGIDSNAAEVYLPKFTVTYAADTLNGVLSFLGMPSAFCGGPSDFTRLADVPIGQLCLSDVRHKAFVQVDEQGTEAAAVTSIEDDFDSLGGTRTIMIASPFLFVIRERFSGTILFIGRMMNPAAT